MTISRSFHRFTILLCLASAPAVLLPQAAGAQASTVMDLGDAPDSSNAFGATMHAYPGVLARFPTSLVPDEQPPGPRHINAGLLYHLGNSISNEAQAEQGADADGINNIIPNFDIVDNDDGDDGLILPSTLQHCKRTQLRYRVHVTHLVSAPVKVYVNLWADWNRDGSWTPPHRLVCPGVTGTAAEWAVSNQPIMLPGPGSYLLTTPAFLVWNDRPTSNMWLRFGLSDSPAPDPDGRGPNGGYARGETEDYRLEGEPQPVLIPPIQRVTPVALEGKRSALALSTVYLPLVRRSGVDDLPIAVPGGKLKEVDVAHIGGTSGGPKLPLIVSAVGTGATVRLASWSAPANVEAPKRLADSPNIVGYDVKLHVLTPDISPDLTYNLLVSAVRDAQENLWLTTWRLNDDGTFVQLGKRGYGSNADVDVRAYALAHRPLLRQNRSVDMFQVVTPIHTADDTMRLISWSVNPTTGAINGLQDSGNWGDPASDTTVDAATLTGEGQTGPYYVVSYRDGQGRLATNSWEVNAAGMPFARGFGESGVDIRGTSPNETYVGDQAIAPLTATGFVSAHTNNSQSRVTSWENRAVACSVMGCVHTPHYISDNSQDLNPATGIGIGEPSIVSERALLVDALGATEVTDTDTLFQQGDGQQGIASVTKVMTLIMALEAVQDNLVTLDDEVEISATAAAVGGSQMALEEGETQTLRTLLQGLMIESGNDAAQAIAEHVGCALSPPDDMPCGDSDETEDDHAAYTEVFIERIMDMVVELGMGSSIYCQPAGGCFSTSQDQVGLWLSAYKTPQFQEFAGAEQYDADACGETEDGEEKCYTNSRTVADRYPGMESWKGGSLGFFCDDVDDIPLCASGGCLGAQVTRLSRTLVLNQLHSQASRVAVDRWTDAYNLYDYGYERLFTPDFRGDASQPAGGATDFGIDNIQDTQLVSAVLTPAGALKLCNWQVVAGIGQIGLLACAERTYTDLPGGSQAFAPTRLDILRLSTLESEGDYVSGQLENGSLKLRAWRVAERP